MAFNHHDHDDDDDDDTVTPMTHATETDDINPLPTVVPVTRRSSLGDRAFAVAGPRAWNSLPH